MSSSAASFRRPAWRASEHAVVQWSPRTNSSNLNGVVDRGRHQARAFAIVHEERFAIAPAAQFDGLVAAHEVVVRRVEREQHPHASLASGAHTST